MVFGIQQVALLALLAFLRPGPGSDASPIVRSQHYSFYSDRPEIYLRAIEEYRRGGGPHYQELTGGISGGILPHHFVAHRMMVDLFENLKLHARPTRIILIGPDHYRKGRAPITVSSLDWKTPFGMLRTDQGTAADLRARLGVEKDDEAFSGEHSVGVIIPFVRHYFPDTRVLTILVKKQVPISMQRTFDEWLTGRLKDTHTIVLLSMDFSHYQTPDEADRRDSLSGRAILELNESLVDQLDIDCHFGFRALLHALNNRGRMKPLICNHTNSARILRRPEIKSVTSYHTVIFLRTEGDS